jgi:hypothetical protein
MKPTALGLICVCMLGVALVRCPAVAQDSGEAHQSFGCSNPEGESTFNAELNHPSKLAPIQVADEKEIAQAQNGGWHTLYSKINAAKYKIERVDFYVHQERPKEPEQSPPYAPLTIYVKLTSSSQISLWKVVETESKEPDERFLLANLFYGEDDEGDPVSIAPATGDRTVPLFDVQFTSQHPGTWARSVEAHIMLDFRQQPPAIAADLSCNSLEAFGVCGVWDGAMQDRNNYECDWVTADNDFRCEAATWNPEISKRRTTSWFHLLSGKDIPFAVPSGNPGTLQEFAELAERDPSWRNRQVELPGLGKTSHILRIVDGPRRSSHIFGTYGGTQPFGAHFFYVILTPGESAELGYIPTLSLFDDDPDDKLRHQEVAFAEGVADQQKLPTPTNQIDTGASLSFAVKELFSVPLTHIYRVTAREEASRAVYWLAIDDQSPDGKTAFSMTKLASNQGVYAGCGRYRTEASAAVITPQKARNFRVLIDAERSHLSSAASEGFLPPDENNGEKLEDQCPYSHHLEWNHKEWVTDEAVTKCGPSFSPRAISIDDDGNITAKPAQIDTSQ